MPEKTIYISYRPEQSLHIAQPLFNGLRSAGYDVFMDIEAGIDDVNLHQVAAREHFIMLLTPGAFTNAQDTRLTDEFTQAIQHKRNIVALLTRDFDFESELENTQGLLAHLPRVPTLRIQPKQVDQVIEVMTSEHLQKGAHIENTPTPPDEVGLVEERIKKAHEYTQQATIRLNTEKLFFKAVVKIRRGNYDDALTDLDLVISDNPNNESAYLHRGRVLRKKGRKTAALKDYEQAAKLSPKLVAAHIGRGELLLETERYQQAATAFQHALQLQEESAPAIAGMALTRFALDDLGEAHKLWNWLIERDANYADAQWAGEVFDWDDVLIERAQNLISKQ